MTGQPTIERVTGKLSLRLTEVESVGREPGTAAVWSKGTDYSLNTDIVTGALLSRAPSVDAAAVRQIGGEFRRLIDHSRAQGGLQRRGDPGGSSST
jgi:hypothetical protein